MEKKYMLGRIVNHDKRSLTFGFNTTGLSIIDIEHKRLVPPFNQALLPSCTGNAGNGAINTEPFLPNKVYTPDEEGAIKLWSEALKIDGGVGYPPQEAGSSGLSIAKALYNSGVISGYQHVFTLEDTLKALSLYPVISGMNWFTQMFTPDADGRVHPIGTVVGGHEVEAYKVDTKLGRIWFYNSWLNPDGTLWGVEGKFYLTWADFADLLSQYGDVTVLFPILVTPPTPVYKTLRLGSKGELVKTLQTILNKNGAKLVVDGSFGLKTKSAVMVYQIKNSLVADGIVGPQTWAILNKVLTPVSTLKIDLWMQAIIRMEGAKPERNNPGNIRFIGQQFAVNDNGFCKFDTYEHGYDALHTLLMRACGGLSKLYNADGTLYDFYNVYAPASDGNNPIAYAEFVAKYIGVSPYIIIKTLI